MTLEDGVIAFSPGMVEIGTPDRVRVEILTLERVHNAGNAYSLVWKNEQKESIIVCHTTVTEERRKEIRSFVGNLKPGDQFIVVYSGRCGDSVYGPIEKDKFLDLC